MTGKVGAGWDGRMVIRTPYMIRDRLVKLELHAPQPVGYVGVVNALDKHLPRMCVVIGNAWRFGVRLFIEDTGGRAVDEGPEYLHSFDALACAAGWRHSEWLVKEDSFGRRRVVWRFFKVGAAGSF